VLKDQIGVVTGGARGLGAAIAEELAEQGAHVVIADVDGAAAEATAARLRSGGLAVQSIPLDVADRAAVRQAAQRVAAEVGKVSILVNNAGIGLSAASIDDDGAAEEWDRTIAVNMTGVYDVTLAFLPNLRETRGSVVNLCSVVAFTSGFAGPGYTASKGAVRSLTQKLARDLAPDGVRVNAVAPGYIDANFSNDAMRKKLAEWIGWHCPMGRFGTPAEIAEPVAFLVSSAARYITGVTLPVDGGYLTV
jgi:NAD(P)-dependent dehydrogenase (short-subunit alcohol dehydrogenase family)